MSERPCKINVGQGTLERKPAVIAARSLILVEDLGQGIGGMTGGRRTDGGIGNRGRTGHPRKIGRQNHGIVKGGIIPNGHCNLLETSAVRIGGSGLEGHHAT